MRLADLHLPQPITAVLRTAVLTAALLMSGVSRLVYAQETDLPQPHPSEAWSAPSMSTAPLFDGPPSLGEPNGCRSNPTCFDPRAQQSTYSSDDFSMPSLCDQPYNACDELNVYGGKHLNPTQRPWIEWGMPLYDTGPVPPPTLEF